MHYHLAAVAPPESFLLGLLRTTATVEAARPLLAAEAEFGASEVGLALELKAGLGDVNGEGDALRAAAGGGQYAW